MLSDKSIAAGSVDQCRLAWHRLLEGSRPVPNADPIRFDSVAGAMGTGVSPWIQAEWEQGKPIAALIGRRSRRRVAPRMGYLPMHSPALSCLDIVYGGILTDSSRRAVEWTATRLIDVLERERCDAVIISHLDSRHPLISYLADRWPMQCVLSEPHLRLTFPDSYDDLLRSLSRKHRYNLSRMDRLLARQLGDAPMGIVVRGDKVDEFAARAAAVTNAGYQGELGVGFRAHPAQVAVLRTEADAGRLLCFHLDAGSEMVAYWIGSRYGDVYFGESTAFLPRFRSLSPGSVLLQRVFAYLIAHGVREFDYGFGDAAYKRQFYTDEWTECTITLFSRSMRGRTAWAISAAASATAAVFQRVDPIVQSMKRAWRRRLEKQADFSNAADER